MNIFGAEGIQDPLANLRHEHELRVVGAEMYQRHQEKCSTNPVQQLQIIVLDGVVDALLKQEGDADVGCGVERHRNDGKNGVPLVRSDVGH